MTPDEIRKCSDEELSRLIAEHVYTWNPVCPWQADERQWIVKHSKGCWSTVEDGQPVHGRHCPDMVSDPTQSMMLLEKLVRREGNTVALSRWLNINDTFVVRECDDDEGVMTGRTYAAAPTIGRALAECYAQSIQKEQVL